MDKAVVVPGEELATGIDFLPGYGTFREGEQIIASRLGVATVEGSLVKVMPLSGKYLPMKNDVIIGKVTDVAVSGWRVELNSAYSALLSMKDATSEFIPRGSDLTRFYDIGDYMITKIINVTSQCLVDLTMKGPGLHKLPPGRIIRVDPNKVPRIIGKQGSMVTLVKDATGCKIMVGQNGVIWVQGTPKTELVAISAIRKIEEEAHVSGLTERMKAFLEKNR